MTIPATVSVLEGDDDEDDATSVISSQAPSQVATSSQATSQPPHDKWSSRAASTGRKLDDAIFSLVDQMKENSAVHDRLQTAEEAAARPRIAFCQWMGLELAKLNELLWNDFMDEAFAMVAWYKRAQAG